jgi:hypothetical protein
MRALKPLAAGNVKYVLILFLLLVGSCDSADAKMGTKQMFVSNLDPMGNVLPQYRWMCKTDGGEFNPTGYCVVTRNPPYRQETPHPPPCQVEADPECPDHALEGLWNFTRTTTLPYNTQDTYDRVQVDTQVPVIYLESDALKATITPQWGGRLWALRDKKTNKDLFFDNKYLQANNDALRQAYLQGGSEWNFGTQMGHMSQTADSISAARIPTSRGDVVRVWGYERISRAIWQVDMLAGETNGSSTMWMHMKLTNPNPYPLAHAYWWTNVAINGDVGKPDTSPWGVKPPNEQVRILTPAKNWVSDAGLSAYPPWPKFIGKNWMATGSWDKNESEGNW